MDAVFVEDIFGMSNGHVMDLSNRAFADFVRRAIGVEIDDPRFAARGSSKANRLRVLWDEGDAYLAARLLRALWDYRTERRWTAGDLVETDRGRTEARLLKLVANLEKTAGRSATDSIASFNAETTLDELIAAINRDIEADRHAAALDRLHTYCMKRFAHLLENAGLPWDRHEPLHSRFGKYVKHLEAANSLSPMSITIMKNSINVFQQFNDVRNNRSFAHDNEIVAPDEARFIFDTVVCLLRFLNATS